jgi:stage V sporulation protein G
VEITEVRINPSRGGKVKAFVSIVIDDSFVVNDLRVLEGREGQFFVTMPGRKSRNGQMRDIAHPLNTDTRQAIEDRILEEFEAAVASRAVPSPDGPPAKKKDRAHALDRLAARLFDEEFWVSDIARDDDVDNGVEASS